MNAAEGQAGWLPAWLPEDARTYLRHTGDGVSLRELARKEGVHASTVLRRVRAFENRRDDPLVDEALDVMARVEATPCDAAVGEVRMTVQVRRSDTIADGVTVAREARRVLRRLCEPGAMLAIAPDMERAVVMKGAARLAVLERSVAQAFALKDWIVVSRAGKVTTYEITGAGRAALKRLMASEGRAEEAGDCFGDQHRDIEDAGPKGLPDGARRTRYNLAESPLSTLARRRDKDGEPFLTPEMVTAGERLREDFELAQLGPRVAQNWERFLTGADRGFGPDSGAAREGGSSAARDRVASALRDLGPGLGDMVLRCCCFLEGLETAEQRLGWSARSGKIVLRIALTRLARHYREAYGRFAPMIG